MGSPMWKVLVPAEIRKYLSRVVWDGGSGFIPTEKKISVEYSN